jgi:hypothetical protein
MKNTKVRIPRLLILLLLFANFASRASAANKGFVIAMGGGNGTPEIYEKWRTLSGGTSAHVVLIPTANNPGDDIAPVLEGLRQIFGIQDVSVLDTKDRAKANSAEFVAPLKQARFVFIDGGRQWRLADTYLGTRVKRELRNVLKRRGVIAGSSAGASILASYLVRGDPKSPVNALVSTSGEFPGRSANRKLSGGWHNIATTFTTQREPTLGEIPGRSCCNRGLLLRFGVKCPAERLVQSDETARFTRRSNNCSLCPSQYQRLVRTSAVMCLERRL